MMNGQPSTSEVDEFDFANLPPVGDLSQSGALIQSHIKGHDWKDSFNCITELRKINKFHPEYIPKIIERFDSTILDLLNNGKSLLVKNIFKLIKELFDAGQQVNVEKGVFAFLPVLIKKASTDIGYKKTLAQEALTSFSANCGYEISFIISSQSCCDKNSSIAELSIKLLSVLVEKVGAGIMQLSQNTLESLMKNLSFLVEGNRQNLKCSALDICIYICNAIGSENYIKLMQFCLNESEFQSMGSSMESHRQSKNKNPTFKQVIKGRKTQALNADFFNENKFNNNYIPLSEMNMNHQQYENYNHSNYNGGNGYNHNNYNSGNGYQNMNCQNGGYYQQQYQNNNGMHNN